MKGVTSSGFEFDVSDNIVNDMELFEALCDLDAGKYTALPIVCRKVIGDQKGALYDHVREPDGRVPIDKVSAEIVEIFGIIRDGKKS